MVNVRNFSLRPGPTEEEKEAAEAFSWLVSSCAALSSTWMGSNAAIIKNMKWVVPQPHVN